MRHIYIIIVMLTVPVLAQAQYQVEGTVLNAADETPLPGATVFLSRTTKGTSTDSNGGFAIKNLPEGDYDLVVSFVGFETLVIPFTTGKTFPLTLFMKPAVVQLDELQVQGKEIKQAEWRKNYTLFRRNFIGLTENAKTCKLENAKVLDFNTIGGLLNATANEPLLIRNDGLGLKIRIWLEKYSLNLATQKLLYQYQMVYEYMEPSSKKQELELAKNRLRAYHGSEMHFMRSLVKGQTTEEGFYCRVSNDKIRHGQKKLIAQVDTTYRIDGKLLGKTVVLVDAIHPERFSGVSEASLSTGILSFDGQLEVTYVHELENVVFQRVRKKARNYTPAFQTSKVVLSKPSVSIDANGFVRSEAVVTQGYWSWELVAESLPLDYQPEVDLVHLDK